MRRCMLLPALGSRGHPRASGHPPGALSRAPHLHVAVHGVCKRGERQLGALRRRERGERPVAAPAAVGGRQLGPQVAALRKVLAVRLSVLKAQGVCSGGGAAGVWPKVTRPVAAAHGRGCNQGPMRMDAARMGAVQPPAASSSLVRPLPPDRAGPNAAACSLNEAHTADRPMRRHAAHARAAPSARRCAAPACRGRGGCPPTASPSRCARCTSCGRAHGRGHGRGGEAAGPG